MQLNIVCHNVDLACGFGQSSLVTSGMSSDFFTTCDLQGLWANLLFSTCTWFDIFHSSSSWHRFVLAVVGPNLGQLLNRRLWSNMLFPKHGIQKERWRLMFVWRAVFCLLRV
jgi:hypothetical protein